eukprot:scaffold2442_cov146-Cylindrotheca_fusiformis.AAC.17
MLEYLTLESNYLTGPLPSSLADLHLLKFLSLKNYATSQRRLDWYCASDVFQLECVQLAIGWNTPEKRGCVLLYFIH